MILTIKDSLTDRQLLFLNVTRAFEEENCGGVNIYKKEKDGTISYCRYPMFTIISVSE